MAYLQDGIILSYLQTIEQDSWRCRGLVVNFIWYQMLQFYFPLKEARVVFTEQGQYEVTLGILEKNSTRKKGIVIRCRKCPKNPKGIPTARAWTTEADKLTRCMLRYRNRQMCFSNGAFAAIAIGKYVKFFDFPNEATTLLPFDDDPRVLNFREDAYDIEMKLSQMKICIEARIP